jgi:hypothetical protein
MINDHQVNVLMLAYKLEISLGNLYEVFVECFTDHNLLWRHLMKEEKEHAETIRKLYQLSYDKKSSFDAGSIKPEAIQSVIDYVNEISDSVNRGKLSESQALKIAYDLESSIFEKDLFTHFKVTAEYSDMLNKVIEEDKLHIQLTRNELHMF